jgi:kynurenine formamidase
MDVSSNRCCRYHQPTRTIDFMQITEIIDLSHELYDGMPTLGAAHIAAGRVGFWELETRAGTRKLSGGKLAVERRMFMMAEHTGTHLDVPRHFVEDGTPVDKVPLEDLILPGHLLDLRGKSVGEAITVEDFRRAEEASGKEIGSGTAIIAWTGFETGEKVWANKGFESQRPHFPVETADWLCERKITLFGTDVIGMDDPGEWWWPTHYAWLSQGIPMCQQLANLDKLKGKEFVFAALPLKMREGTASPVRAVAFVG